LLTILPTDFLSIGGDGNYDGGGGLFLHFGIFCLLLAALKRGNLLGCKHFLIPTGILHQQILYPTDFCSPGEHGDEIPRLCYSSDWTGYCI
jgi:hypothetical protein